MGWYTAVIVCCGVLDDDKLDAINAFFDPTHGLKSLEFGARNHPQAYFYAEVFKAGTIFRSDPEGDSSLSPGTPGWDEFLAHLRSIPWDEPHAVRILTHDEHDASFTLYGLDGAVAGKSPKG